MTTAFLGSAYFNSIPTAGGKPAQMRVSPAGDLWLVNFGAGGTPNKVYGIEAYSLANPLAPTRLSFTGSPTFAWFNVEQIRFRATTMFAIATSTNSIQAVDITSPAAPTQIGAGLVLAATPVDFALSADQLTAVVACSAGGLRAVDITTPAAMVALGGVVAGTFLGVDTSLWPLVIVTESATGQLRIYDYTAPAAPVLVGSVALPVTVATTGLRRVVVDTTTNTAFVAVTGGGPLTGGQAIYAVNIAVPAAPVLVATIPCAVAGDDTPISIVSASGKRVLVVPLNSQSFSPARIETFDVTTPSSPKFLRGLDLGQVVYDVMVLGAVTYASNRGGAQELLVLDSRFLAP